MNLTGALQFIILIVALTLLASTILIQENGLLHLLHKLPESKLIILDHPKFWQYVVILAVPKLFPSNPASAHAVRRLRTVRSTARIQRTTLGIAVFCLAFPALLAIISFAGYINLPNETTYKQVLYKLVALHIPHGLQGFAVAGIFMLVISGIDLNLYARSLVNLRNTVRPLLSIARINANEARLILFTLSSCAVMVALQPEDVMRMLSFTFGVFPP